MRGNHILKTTKPIKTKLIQVRIQNTEERFFNAIFSVVRQKTDTLQLFSNKGGGVKKFSLGVFWSWWIQNSNHNHVL